MKNGPEVISYKLTFETFHAFDTFAIFVIFDSFIAFVQQYQSIKSSVSKISESSNSKISNQVSCEKKNKSENMQHQLANDVASAKVICHINFVENDFVSAEVITASNKSACDWSAYDQLADMLSFIDIFFSALYKSIESD